MELHALIPLYPKGMSIEAMELLPPREKKLVWPRTIDVIEHWRGLNLDERTGFHYYKK